ncbi:MAG: protein TolR [Pseudomonadales bacterium]|nr:protein TolR [Pseudomonadales bacterium]
MEKLRPRRKPMSEINVVPYIDVMLVLLIVFMVTAPLLTQGVKVELPKADAQPIDNNQEPVIIAVDKNGQYFLNLGKSPDSPIVLDDLQDKVLKILRNKPNIPILIEGDDQVPYGKVVFLMASLQAAGTTNVGLITESIPVPKR